MPKQEGRRGGAKNKPGSGLLGMLGRGAARNAGSDLATRGQRIDDVVNGSMGSSETPRRKR